VLFDYALARLMLRVDEARLAALLRDRPDLALVARPSLTLHFQCCWEQDRELFWRLTFALAEDQTLPLLGRAAAPAVAAQAISADDLRPLTEALAGSDSREGARQALVHVIGSALAAGSRQRPLQGRADRCMGDVRGPAFRAPRRPHRHPTAHPDLGDPRGASTP
jgi:hypothetical protein